MADDGTVRIALTRGMSAIVDAEDAPALLGYSWQAINPRRADLARTYYARRAELHPDGGQEHLWMHRLIMDAPDGMEVDHRDGDGLNNRRSNLRICTVAQNRANRRIAKSNKSGFKGVYREGRGNGWVATICVMYRNTYLGLYPSAEEAARVYDTAAVRMHGEFACLNFPDDYRVVEPRLAGQQPTGVSGFRGVIRVVKGGKVRWLAKLMRDGKWFQVGTFDSPEEAAAARETKMALLKLGR